MDFFKNIPRPIWIFTLIWFIAGLLQAGLMELHPDEAYYWQMSRFMDWGFFHQPPMISLFIKIGYSLFQNEFGVRLLTVLASSMSLLFLFKLSEVKNTSLFILVILSLILTQAGVFFAAPDSPLIFFTLLFLVILKLYLEKGHFVLAFILAVIIAALMYSKYHAIVLFGACLIAAPKIVTRPSFWFMAVLSVLLFVPHVIWQFEHDFISFKFHWVVREKKIWDATILLDYIVGQLLLLSPAGIILLIAAFRNTTEEQFDRVLKTIIVFVFGFFFVMALRGKVEANWTATAFIPIIILGTRGLERQEGKLLRIFKPVAMVSATLLIVARIYLMTPWAGIGLPTVFPLKGWKTWASAIQLKAKGRPVVFTASYQFPSLYSFYSGAQAYHWSPLNYNGNQFDLWDIDYELTGKPFVLAMGYGEHNYTAVKVDGFSTIHVYPVDAYCSLRNLRFEFQSNSYEATIGSEIQLEGSIVNRGGQALNIDSLFTTKPPKFFYYLNGTSFPSKLVECTGCTGQLLVGQSKLISFKIQVPKEPGKYFVRFGLDFALGMQEQNSDFIKLTVKEP